MGAASGGAEARRVGATDVARYAGVAVSSVSRVLAGHRDASPEMRRRVLAAADALGYEPNLIAGSLRRGATMVAGFIGHDLSEPAMLESVVGAERHFREHGYSMILASCVGSEALAADSVRALRRRRVDGVVLALSGDARRAMMEQFRDLAEPSVAVGGLLSTGGSRSVVRIDRAAGLRAAVEHLARLGHRTIGLIGRAEDIHLLEDGISRPPTVLVQPVTVGEGGDVAAADARIAVRRLLDDSPVVSDAGETCAFRSASCGD